MNARLALLPVLFASACHTARRPDEKAWQEWFSLSSGVLERTDSGSSGVSDSLAWTIEGGDDFVAHPFRIGPEIGASWSRQDLDASLSTEEDPVLETWRFAFGARLSLEIDALGAVAYVRGGIYSRDTESKDVPSLEDDSTGRYVGAGIEFWFDEHGRIGPFVRWQDSRDSDLEERVLGLAVTFAL